VRGAYNPDIANEFYKNAEPAILFMNITETLKKEECEKLIDEYKSKIDRVWSELGHQVFGAENLK
jgi:hypothetical protein